MYRIINKENGEVTDYTSEEFEAERTRLLAEWEFAKIELDIAKEKEIKARKKAVDFSFNPEKTSGTERIDLANGYQAKAVKKINYGFIKNSEGKLDKKAIDRALEKIETLGGEVGEIITQRLVKWTPDLSIAEYKNLDEKYKKIIDEVIITTEGAPTLEIIEPKFK